MSENLYFGEVDEIVEARKEGSGRGIVTKFSAKLGNIKEKSHTDFCANPIRGRGGRRVGSCGCGRKHDEVLEVLTASPTVVSRPRGPGTPS